MLPRLLPPAFVLLCAMVVAVAGCGDDAGTTTTTGNSTTTAATVSTDTTDAPTTTTASTSTTVPTPGTSSTTTEAPTTTTEAEQLSSAETRLPNGDIKGMGFIDRVWVEDGVRYLSIDYAEFLTGEEANQAAVDAGVIEPGEDVPNDYFIRNVNPKKREFTVSDSVAITTATRWAPNDGPAAPCAWEDFLSFCGPGPLPDGDSQLHAVPWWIIRTGAEVYSVEEQYIP
ncbi:MAG: hypothetical protein JW990_06960 [Thermoleophilia bacterium]|nr:hypothetical protein [Thermoleophilia bacterium]